MYLIAANLSYLGKPSWVTTYTKCMYIVDELSLIMPSKLAHNE